MSSELSRWLLALGAATMIAVLARSRRSLSVSGMLAAIATGTILVGTAGWWAGLLLVAFFVSSSILSRNTNDGTAIEQARGTERDALQVLANGGIALLAGIALALTGNTGWLLALTGSIAAVNSDTWSTEIGRRSRSHPRLITTGRQVSPGTSGAVSRRGLLGALAGAALIAILATVGRETGWMPLPSTGVGTLLAVTAGGFSGALLDSLLGATVQDQRWCDSCEKVTEQRLHRCGTRTRSIRGHRWIDNDVVNSLCAVAGGAIAWIVGFLVM